MSTTRRDFIKQTGLGLLAFEAGGTLLMLSPAEARRRKIPYQKLTPDLAATLEALGETLVPGAAEEGIAHYVDQQLGSSADRSMLMIRYLGVPPPFDGFYREGLQALNDTSASLFDKPFAALDASRARSLVQTMSSENPEGWSGPPAPFFYFVARGDAIDVVYGTVKGFERLGIPYMAHINPPSKW